MGRLRIQRAGGLVAQQHLGICCQRPGDGNPLLLSAAQLRRVGVCFVRQPHGFQQLHGFRLRLRPGCVNQLQRQHDVLQAAPLHQQVEALENHGNLVPHLLNFLFPQRAQIHPVPYHGALRRPLQHVDAAHQGAFSRAAHTDNTVDIPVMDRQAHMLQGIHRTVPGYKALAQISQLNHGFCLPDTVFLRPVPIPALP